MRLVELRKQKGKSQAEVAKFINVSQVAYSKYETGKSEPSNDILTKLADYFDVSVDYLLGRNEATIPDDYKNLETAFSDLRELTQNQIDEVIKFSKFIKERDKKE